MIGAADIGAKGGEQFPSASEIVAGKVLDRLRPGVEFGRAHEHVERAGLGVETQDVAVAVTFLITELVELAMTSAPRTQVHISLKPDTAPDRAILRVSAPALTESKALQQALAERYGRVIEGLARQLRSKLHHEPLVGAYEISIAVTGRD